jgi:hypothetical protein
MYRKLDQSLFCSVCKSGNCKLWRFREDNWETANLYCLLCLVDKNYLSSEILDIKWFGDSNFVFPGDPNKLVEYKEHFIYLNKWVMLSQLPNWWNYDSVKNLSRAIQIRKNLQKEAARLSVQEVGFVFESSKKDFYMILISNSSSKEFTIPEVAHIISWLQNISGPLPTQIFSSLCEKIHKKYV